MADVKLVQTIDDRDVVTALANQLKLQEKLIRNMDRLGKSGQKSGKETETGFSRATREIGRMATALIGVGSITTGIQRMVQLVRREIENIRSRQTDAGQTQIELAAAQRDALLNFGGGRGAELNQLAAGISSSTGASQLAVQQALSKAFSFKGASLSDQQAADAVRVAARLTPGDAEAIKVQSQGILGQQKITGGTAEQIAGFQVGVKRLSPVSENEDFSNFVAPLIGDLVRLGNNVRDAGAVSAAFGQSINDPSGRQTATAAVRLQAQLNQFVPNVEGFFNQLDFIRSEAGTAIRQRLLGALDEERTQAENEAAAASGVVEKGEASARAKAFATITDLLQRQGNATQALFAETRRQVPTLAESGTFLNREIAAINRNPLQVTAAAQRTFQIGSEELQLLNIRGGRASVTREGLQKLFKDAGVSATGQTLEGLGFEAGTEFGTEGAPLGFAASRLRDRARRLTDPRTVSTTSAIQAGADFGGGTGLPTIGERTVTEEDRRNAEIFADIARKLEQLVALQTQQGAEQIEQQQMTNRKLDAARPATTRPPTAALSN
jgi:hypothetical protein